MFCKIIKILFIVYCIILSVVSMSIEGPPQVRYDPCGLGVIHIDKMVTSTIWKAVVNLGLYPELHEAEIRMVFKVPVALVSISHMTLVNLTNDYNWSMKVAEDLPKQFVFYIKVNDVDTVPKMNIFSLNGDILCSSIKEESHSVESFNITGNETGLYKHICGRRSMKYTELTTTEDKVERGVWPWHVAVFIRKIDSKEAVYQCGGNIISRTAVVTAGHCLSKAGVVTETKRIVIFAGVVDLKQVDDIDTQMRSAQKIILHPSYNDADATADLAVIKIFHLVYTEYVQPACLWGPSFDKSELFGKSGVIAGFGMTENDTFSEDLRSARNIVQNDTECTAFSSDLYQTLLNEFTFCAGNGPTIGTSPRTGDSGGGLLFPTLQADHKVSWFLRGVLSKCAVTPGIEICDPRFYAVYNDIGPHYTWLLHHAGIHYKCN